MATITEKTVREGKNPCGFCSTGGRHDLCPGGVLNGDQTTVILCGCQEHPVVARCMSCGARGDEVSMVTWTCLDAEECENRVSARRRKLDEEFGRYAEAANTRKAEKATERAPKAARGGSCLCCGEATKGGLFLPGHDARLLSRLAAEIKAGAPHGKIENELREAGASDALLAKLNKRVA